MSRSILAILVVAALAAVAFAVEGPVDKCQNVKDQGVCESSFEEGSAIDCVWCLSKTVPSFCASKEQAEKLPPSVFNCFDHPAQVAFTEDAALRQALGELAL